MDPKPIQGDPNMVSPLFDDFHDWNRQFVDSFSEVSDKSIELHKQISSFHERLILVNIGTIGLSVSALISLAGKIALATASRHAFVSYVVPAWVLLLISIITSRNVMAYSIRVNRTIITDWQQSLAVTQQNQTPGRCPAGS